MAFDQTLWKPSCCETARVSTARAIRGIFSKGAPMGRSAKQRGAKRDFALCLVGGASKGRLGTLALGNNVNIALCPRQCLYKTLSKPFLGPFLATCLASRQLWTRRASRHKPHLAGACPQSTVTRFYELAMLDKVPCSLTAIASEVKSGIGQPSQLATPHLLLEAQQRHFSYRAILVAIVSQESFVLAFMGYRTIIARYVAKWVSRRCACVKLSTQRGVSHNFGGVLDSLEKASRDFVSQYRAIWGH